MAQNNPYQRPGSQRTEPIRTQPTQHPNARINPASPTDPMAQYQPVTIHIPPPAESRPRGCYLATALLAAIPVLVVIGLLAVYFLSSKSTNLLILGIDRPPAGTDMSRTDTMILVSITPRHHVVKMLSIPRDLWVPIPGHGENRINTAHFYAEIDKPGSGPAAAQKVVEDNFQVKVPYYVRIQFTGFEQVVDAMGGVDVNLPAPELGMPAGINHMDGQQALAFVRDRKGADDFYRMSHGQLLLKSALAQLIKPSSWSRLPAVVTALRKVTDTNLPVWEWPRLALALVRAGPSGIDNHTLPREMTTPFITSGGADVLLPKWNLILPYVHQMFGN